MIADHRGVIDIPVKLAVCFLVLGLMVPLVTDVVFDSEDRFSVQALQSEDASLHNGIQAAYRRNVVTYWCDFPAGQTLLVGGEREDAYTIRLRVDGEMVESLRITSPTTYVDKLVTELSDNAVVVLDGKVSGRASCGGSGMRVTLL